ncbi:MAG TPA: Gfo/Idh/MocA family oxidoreductase [Bryobacteraceae bacterium]|nr:Gfo/Idh/MocA family oxidoreductase [Bryobacteraceae bacterium]
MPGRYSSHMNRREFLSSSAVASLAVQTPPVRIGVIGAGNRGNSLLRGLISIDGVQINALCDPNPAALDRAATAAAAHKPDLYSQGDNDYKRLLGRDDLDAVVIAAPWAWHATMAVEAMKSGKAVACEVPIAQTVEECWQLVDTNLKTKVPCMMLENWSFRRDNLAVLNMIRAGLLGDMVHCHCAHSHDCIDHWFFDKQGNDRWPARYLAERDCDQYPTHSLGPILSWLDINCGDAFATIASTSTSQRGINAYFARQFGPEHPNAKRRFAQGDIVTSTIKTRLGRTVVVNYDMQLPRPYDNRWMAQGTLGLYDEDKQSVYLTGRSPKYHEWEPFAPYQSKYDHKWWTEMTADGNTSHGGTDGLELSKFVEAVRAKTPLPIDIYDSIVMSAVIELSARSIKLGGAPVEFPDFTRGAWKTRKPYFAL